MKKKFGVIWVILLVVLDQITKYVAQSYLVANGPVDVIKNVFQFHYLENTGIAFGLFKEKFAFFVVTTIIILAVIGYIYYKMPDTKRYRPLQFCLIFIAAGAVGNMIDRIVNNYVIDFLYFKLIDFPIFNVADCYVTCAVAVLFVLLLFVYKDEELTFIQKGNKKER
ncbi:MAG: signal peptidase II [bacterium]|nr:signal peptidase II [bacterium]